MSVGVNLGVHLLDFSHYVLNFKINNRDGGNFEGVLLKDFLFYK